MPRFFTSLKSEFLQPVKAFPGRLLGAAFKPSNSDLFLFAPFRKVPSGSSKTKRKYRLHQASVPWCPNRSPLLWIQKSRGFFLSSASVQDAFIFHSWPIMNPARRVSVLSQSPGIIEPYEPYRCSYTSSGIGMIQRGCPEQSIRTFQSLDNWLSASFAPHLIACATFSSNSSALT